MLHLKDEDVFTKSHSHKQVESPGQFLNKAKLVWLQSFPSPRPVGLPRLKNSVCPNILLIEINIVSNSSF